MITIPNFEEENQDPEVQKFLDEYRPPSIDRPPHGEPEKSDDKRAEQLQMFEDQNEHEVKVKEIENENPAVFGYEMKLILKPNATGKSFSIHVCVGVSYPDRVERSLDRSFNSERFRTVLRAILGTLSNQQPADTSEFGEPLLELPERPEPSGDQIMEEIEESENEPDDDIF